jgi:hypothetical protein
MTRKARSFGAKVATDRHMSFSASSIGFTPL